MFGTHEARRSLNFHVRAAALPGVLTGVFWGCGNFTSFFATAYLGQAIGFPLTQCCVIVSGLWGIMYYREIKGWGITMFAVGVAIIVAGAVLDGSFA